MKTLYCPFARWSLIHWRGLESGANLLIIYFAQSFCGSQWDTVQYVLRDLKALYRMRKSDRIIRSFLLGATNQSGRKKLLWLVQCHDQKPPSPYKPMNTLPLLDSPSRICVILACRFTPDRGEYCHADLVAPPSRHRHRRLALHGRAKL